MRQYFDLGRDEPFSFIAGGQRFEPGATAGLTEFAFVEMAAAGVQRRIYCTEDRHFIELVVVADGDGPHSSGMVRKGWYMSAPIDESRARALRDSWALQHMQPATPC